MLTTGNGGAITTSDPELLALLRDLRGYSYDPGRFFWHRHLPFNVRMSGLQAAVGLAQLDRLDALVAHHTWLAEAYTERLEGVRGVQLPARPEAAGGAPGSRHAWWMYTIHVDEDAYGHRVPALRQALADQGIETRPAFVPLHWQPVLQGAVAAPHRPLPVSEWAAQTGINLPSGANLDEAQIDRVVGIIAKR
jgi:perosamine synthetase